jgi:hypothetical protein
MPISAFPKVSRKKPIGASVSDVTLRDFSGGLRVTDNEIALKSKYASKLLNMFADADTSQVLRFGTKLFATCAATIINTVYFRQHIICVLSDGTITKITDAGVVTVIWNTTIAAALPGAPAGWSGSLIVADFSEFRGKLVITNGIDKPVIIDKTLAVDYLQDLATGSNINTPIAKYVATVSNYLVMAGITGSETTIYISATGASGTWPGDPAPNDAISFDVGAYTGQSSSEIFGIGSFKNFLVVFFDNFTVILQLGSYDSGGAHAPEIIDTYANLGTVNHKTFFSTDSDLFFASNTGVYSAEKNVFGGSLQTSGMSDNLGDLYPATLGLITKNNQNCSIVNDPLSKTVFFLFHKADASVQAFAMKYRDDFKRTSWSEIAGWAFTSSCVSEKGRVFFSEGVNLYQYGNSVFDGEEFYADYTTDGVDGNAIDFDWEFPWLDAGNRIKSKTLKKVTFDTSGTSAFTLQCFVNNYYKNTDDEYIPVTSMDFVAGNAGGYGNNAGGYGDEGYGGGRRANDERFFGMPVRFRILKLRMLGSTKDPLRIVSISLLYIKGNYNT